MTKSKKMMTLGSALLLTIALTACGQAKAPAPELGDVPENITEEQPPAETDTGETDTEETEEHEVITATGEYNGQADPHTIEINVDGTPTSFQLTTAAEAQIGDLNEGDTIEFQYVEHPVEGSDTPQLEIQSLTKTGEATSGAGGDSESSGGEGASDRPATETFPAGDGESGELTGTLEQGDGYSLYVMEGYTFDAAGSKLTLDANPDYFAEIEPLPSDFNVDAIRADATAELEKDGATVKEFDSDTLVESPMVNASLFLQASTDKLVRDYIVWEAQDASGYIFHLSIPEEEEGQPFYIPVTTSLATIMKDPSK
ncbi:hypothetical protein QWJ34_22580 [Saccharibacillus sp. CPCC 101409]|uniref:hypothetical protein n=1 Tax=Saccharibacillus sp. CPCC 101409 TaxID=3058041 RepID=UPI0026733A5B|nr:hypothetical protein [Saccharibacillus sp. CPCC 101409]MDO3412569.1 hypothetical protein [Saccharibacillus sp. CPCC 101409]